MIDFGCGYGYLGTKFMPLLAEGSSYTGIELDQGQIKEAVDIFSKKSFKYEFINENIYDFQSEKKYDLVVAMLLLSYMPRSDELILKMKECLKPGGTILLIDVNMEVEQAGYFSGLEKAENGLVRPDFIPTWEYESLNGERDYRIGTKLPYMLKKVGFQNIEARISDQVVIYEPADDNKRKINDIVRFVYSHEDSYQGGLNYFLNHGCSLQKSKEMVEYYNRTSKYFDEEESIAVKTSGMYFVYATI
jgi:SAM-dependent methyltransferase